MADRDSISHWPMTLSHGAGGLLNLLLPLVLVRLFSPEEVGRYKIFFLYFMLGPGLLLTTGLTNGLYHWAGRYPASRSRIRQSWSWLVSLSLALCSAGYLGAEYQAALLGIPPSDLRLLFLCLPPGLACVFVEDLLVAKGDIWKGALYGSGLNIIQSLVLLAAAWHGGGVESLLRAFLGCLLARMVLGVALSRGSGDLVPLFSAGESAAVLRYALPVSVAGLAALGVHSADKLILSSRLGAEEFAYYAMGCLVVPPLMSFEISVNRVLIPRLAGLLAAGRRAEAAVAHREAVAELYRYLLPAALGLAVYSAPIVTLLFTSRYAAAADFLTLFAFSYLFLALPHDSVARARGDAGWILRTRLFFAPLSVAMAWLAAGLWGAMGALAAVMAVRLAMGLYAQRCARDWLARPYSYFLPLARMARLSAPALAAAAGAIVLRPLFADPLLWFLTTGPLFAAACLGGVSALDADSPRRAPESLRVLELAQTLCLGGLERLVYSLSEALHRSKGFKVLVVSYDHPPETASLLALFEAGGIPCVHWRKNTRFSPGSVLRLVRLILNHRAQIVHAHDLGPLIYGSLAKLLTLGRTRLIFTVHSLLGIEGEPRRCSYLRLFSRFADRIVAVSPGLKLGLAALGVDPDRVEVVPNGAIFPEGSGPRPTRRRSLRRELAPGLPSSLFDAHWLLCLGRLHPGKGQDVVLRVWDALPAERRRELALFFVGQGAWPDYLRELRRRIDGAADGERIVIVPPSDRPQDWLFAADIFISGSSYEAMPLAPLEAAGSGVPTVLSGIEGHRFLDGWARFFDPAVPEEGALRVVEVLREIEGCGRTAYLERSWREAEFLRRKWGSPVMAASYARIFQSVRIGA